MLKELSEMDGYIAKSLDNISSITNEINKSVGLAVRSLQFEDIVNQLLGYTYRHLATLEDFFTVLKGNLDEIHTLKKETKTDYGLRLMQMRDNILHLRENWDTENHKPVHQESMNTGEIELF